LTQQVSFDIMSLYTQVSFDIDIHTGLFWHNVIIYRGLFGPRSLLKSQWHEVTYTEVHTSICEIDMWEKHISVHLSDTSVRYFALAMTSDDKRWQVLVDHNICQILRTTALLSILWIQNIFWSVQQIWVCRPLRSVTARRLHTRHIRQKRHRSLGKRPSQRDLLTANQMFPLYVNSFINELQNWHTGEKRPIYCHSFHPLDSSCRVYSLTRISRASPAPYLLSRHLFTVRK